MMAFSRFVLVAAGACPTVPAMSPNMRLAGFVLLQIPQGVMFGVLGVALPIFLNRLGRPVDEAAYWVALTLSPAGWVFLLSPPFDALRYKGAISVMLGLSGALLVGVALPDLLNGHVTRAGGLFLAAETAIMLFTAIVNTLAARTFPASGVVILSTPPGFSIRWHSFRKAGAWCT